MKGKGCKISRCIGDPEHKYSNAYLHRFESEGADFVPEEFSRFFHPSFTDPANGDFSARLSPTETGYPPGEAAQNSGYGEIGFRKIPIYDVGPYR